MERLTVFTLCLISVLAIAPSSADGQTNAPLGQNSSHGAANGRVQATTAHPNASVMQNIARGPVGFGPRTINSYAPQIAGQHAINLRPTYSPFMRPMNPTLAAVNVRQSARTYNVQSNTGVSPSSEITQTRPPIMNAQRVVGTDNLAKREISGGLETINTQRVARNNNVQLTPRDLANRETRQHTAKWNQQNWRNRFSYSDALSRNWHEWHNRDWWRQHCKTIVLVTGGYYFLDAGYWYPAWGYDPLNSYYDYDGPIYTYGNLLPDEVIANVQVALQDAGYYFGTITGSLNVETRAALANFQRDYGLPITGAIDQPTIETLGLY